MKAQHPFDLLREHKDILFPALLKHALCTLIGLLAVLMWVLYAVLWVVGFLWEFFTDPLLKVNIIEGMLDLLHRLPPSVDLEHTPIVAPVYAYLQRALDDATWEVLGSAQGGDTEPTEPETVTEQEDEFVLHEQTALANDMIDELTAEERALRPASVFTEEDLTYLDERALNDSLDFHE
jgi:hypothetical protein